MQNPYLSLVVTARNDDHGGNLLGRMQLFTDGWIAQARRYRIPSELIIVEWNPPDGRPALKDALRWPEDLGPCEVRFVEVPPELHRRYAHAEALPLYQMIGKNVGIRRARGEFILATNIDILFSNELAEFLARRQLDPKRMYRIDRHDAMSDVPAGGSLDEQLEYCRTHLIRINRREGTFSTAPDGSAVLHSSDVADVDSGIVFGPGWLPPERLGRSRFRWAFDRAELVVNDNQPGSTLVFDIEPGPGVGGPVLDLEIVSGNASRRISLRRRSRLRIPRAMFADSRLVFRSNGCRTPAGADPRVLCLRVFHARLDRKPTAGVKLKPIGPIGRAANAWRAFQYLVTKLAHGGPLVPVTIPVSPRMARLLRMYVNAGGVTGMLRHGVRTATGMSPPGAGGIDFIHCNGCGDFTLLAREKWFDLRGYPEFDVFSMNLDSIFCFAAHYGGAREETLLEPMRIYHIEHGTGSGWTPEGQSQLFDRIAAKGLTFVANDEVLAWAAQMARLQSPMIFNHENWGLSDFALRETVVGTPVKV
ncbi:MAG: hypothetical protein JO307_13900 [Bryobacterales bacterium]|nr:hypothetical protein [Bryobacterales bacterium]MBV9397524.1 hypothetical protein [Bryobacterales bacterium]